MNEGIRALKSAVDEWVIAKAIPENDWGRMRGLDFQELLRTRNALTKQLKSRDCTRCNNFEDHVRNNYAFSSVGAKKF